MKYRRISLVVAVSLLIQQAGSPVVSGYRPAPAAAYFQTETLALRSGTGQGDLGATPRRKIYTDGIKFSEFDREVILPEFQRLGTSQANEGVSRLLAFVHNRKIELAQVSMRSILRMLGVTLVTPGTRTQAREDARKLFLFLVQKHAAMRLDKPGGPAVTVLASALRKLLTWVALPWHDNREFIISHHNFIWPDNPLPEGWIDPAYPARLQFGRILTAYFIDRNAAIYADEINAEITRCVATLKERYTEFTYSRAITHFEKMAHGRVEMVRFGKEEQLRRLLAAFDYPMTTLSLEDLTRLVSTPQDQRLPELRRMVPRWERYTEAAFTGRLNFLETIWTMHGFRAAPASEKPPEKERIAGVLGVTEQLTLTGSRAGTVTIQKLDWRPVTKNLEIQVEFANRTRETLSLQDLRQRGVPVDRLTATLRQLAVKGTAQEPDARQLAANLLFPEEFQKGLKVFADRSNLQYKTEIHGNGWQRIVVAVRGRTAEKKSWSVVYTPQLDGSFLRGVYSEGYRKVEKAWPYGFADLVEKLDNHFKPVAQFDSVTINSERYLAPESVSAAWTYADLIHKSDPAVLMKNLEKKYDWPEEDIRRTLRLLGLEQLTETPRSARQSA